MEIDNKHRQSSWQKIAMEFKSERDALQNDLFRIMEENTRLATENTWLKDEISYYRTLFAAREKK